VGGDRRRFGGTADGSAYAARVLREVLGDGVLPRYERLLDPETAWRHAVDEDFRAAKTCWSLVRACLLAAKGKSPQLRTMLDEIVARRSAHEPFAYWVWEQAA
jgi:hypothetical protein